MTTDLVLTMSADAAIDHLAGDFYQNMNFDGKAGGFHYGADKTSAPDGEYEALSARASAGQRRFKGKGELPDIVAVELSSGKPIPQRPDDETVTGLDGNEAYAWQYFMSVPLLHVTTGETFLFSTASKTGLRALARLLKACRNKTGNPLVKLQTSSFKHERFGKVLVPAFTIVGWSESASEAPRHDLDDDIPFAPSCL